MSSPMSGYIVMASNLSENGPRLLKMSIGVPDNHAIMVQYIVTEPERHPQVRLTAYRKNADSIDQYSYECYAEQHCPKVHKISKLVIAVSRKRCINTSCFELFFTIVPENKLPQELPSGLWNCSVDHYPSFRHHVQCNLKLECEDRRDEAESCPFSRADCQGFFLLCNNCYALIDGLEKFEKDESDLNKRALMNCETLGATVGEPKCAYDWRSILRNATKVHWERLIGLLIGLHYNDLTLPNMYRHMIVGDRTVYYHSIIVNPVNRGKKMCLATSSGPDRVSYSCREGYNKSPTSAICESRKNETGDEFSHSVLLSTTESPLTKDYPSLVTCRNGHLTHSFLLCGSNYNNICSKEQLSGSVGELSDTKRIDSRYNPNNLIPIYTCDDDLITLSYTLVCDFIIDCFDKSDESFCKHPTCVKTFSCDSGQCVSYDKRCDQISHCKDESDERNCHVFRLVHVKSFFFPSPALIQYNNVRYFTSVSMHRNESCPDSHFRCPGDFNDCLPAYTRCNGLYDCIDQQDEEGCKEMVCAGFFRCRASTICVHTDHLCDGWPHCPMYDDELLCGATCPPVCACQGHAFSCRQPFPAAVFPALRLLDGTSSGMTLSSVSKNTYLVHLVLASCSLQFLHHTNLLNLKFLDLSDNDLQSVNMTSFFDLDSLQALSLSHNPLISLHTDLSSVFQQKALEIIDLSHTSLTEFDSSVLSQFSQVQKLNLSFTCIQTITSSGFEFTPQLSNLYMEGSPVKTFPQGVFKILSHLKIITTENYKLCCQKLLPDNFYGSACFAPKDEISSCEDLLQSWTYRGFLWLVACLSLSGNMLCFCSRLFSKSMALSSGFSVFVTNLTVADFLMGVYIAIIGAADEEFRGKYLYYDDIWKNSVACKLAGFLSLLSSEVSALVIWLITLDRFIVLRFPFSNLRFERSSAALSCLLTWVVGCFLSVVPLLPVTSHWEFYSQTGICIPLPITRKEFKGKTYSFCVLIILNFALFLMISSGQTFIYWSVQKNALKSNSTKMYKDTTIARRLITVAVSDFMCWFPIGLCGILALAGIPIPGEVNIALAIFILPLNSAVNPYMYTLNIVLEKQRKSKEADLTKWLESHAEVLST